MPLADDEAALLVGVRPILVRHRVKSEKRGIACVRRRRGGVVNETAVICVVMCSVWSYVHRMSHEPMCDEWNEAHNPQEP